VDWGPDNVRFYLDRQLVFSHITPDDWHAPFYLLVNLAVGGPKSWQGAPDTNTQFPAHLRISAIRAWQRHAYLDRIDGSNTVPR
jgi:beta-glucanase (GH16 family)